ncbi:MAG: diguanylate cyclase [Planctomycetota bacterium]|nr:diguanylate cyclase [Planctomycetota bacterium]
MKKLLKRLPTSVKLTICVVSLIGSELMVARAIGLIDSFQDVVMQSRAKLCESVAVGMTLHAMNGDDKTMAKHAAGVAARNENIRSIGVRSVDGNLRAQAGDHVSTWVTPSDGKSDATHMIVPIASTTGRWGTVEVQFNDNAFTGVLAWLNDSFVQLIAFVTVLSCVVFFLFFGRILRELNPAKVIPGRVRTALDTLTEGLLVLDIDGNVVLANESFSRMVGRSPEAMLGITVAELPWFERGQAERTPLQNAPWENAIRTSDSCTGSVLDFEIGPDERKTLVVNASPIFGGEQEIQGVLVSVDDVTPLEHKKRELNQALEQLQVSSDAIRVQNTELERLATTDPLTECLNRRSFFELFEGHWAKAERHSLPISAIMVDIDFFKSINDQFGHSVGDDVLRKIAATLRTAARTGDLVCRFGGEEFCILLPATDIDEAANAGERFRAAIAATQFEQLSVTASIGVSSRSLGGTEPQEMIDQADKCLYVAKRNGRNQVVRWDDVPQDLEVDESQVSRTHEEAAATEPDPVVPYRAVAALLSTLSFRHAATAAHSQRTADLCVTAADGLLSPRQCYTLEIAALLHDIGKTGVPDSVLLKDGPLTTDDWEVMKHHDRIGVEIVRASFDCQPVTEIVANYRAHFGGTRNRPGVPSRKDLPVGARILAIADAFDSMTTDRSYRAGISRAEAFAELRKCGGTQFDPELVELFIDRVSTRHRQGSPETSTISRSAALNIGQQIEALIDTLETQDFEGMRTLAERLHDVAKQDGLDHFAERADHLRESIDSDGDVLAVLQSASELVDLCRSTHSTWLRTDMLEDAVF